VYRITIVHVHMYVHLSIGLTTVVVFFFLSLHGLRDQSCRSCSSVNVSCHVFNETACVYEQNDDDDNDDVRPSGHNAI